MISLINDLGISWFSVGIRGKVGREKVEKLDPKELVSFKELLMSGVLQSEALVNLLERKRIINKQESLEEIRAVQMSIQEHKT